MKFYLSLIVLFAAVIPSTAEFCAYYTKINSGAPFEEFSRTGPEADIVLRDIDSDKGRFVFWRGSSYRRARRRPRFQRSWPEVDRSRSGSKDRRPVVSYFQEPGFTGCLENPFLTYRRMKNHFLKSLLAFSIAWMAVIPQAAMAVPDLTISGRWTADKANEWYAKQPWLVGCNFTPSTAINQLEMWQADTFDLETIDRELAWAAGMGMNTVRVYLHDLLWQQDSEGFLKRMDQFLGIANKHGIKPMFVLFDACWNSFPKLGKQPEPKPHVHNSGWVQSPHIDTLKDVTRHETLKPYVKGVIGSFRNDTRVLAWDLYNEPGNGSAADGMRSRRKTGVCLILLEHVLEWARNENSSQHLTVGLWTGEWVGPKSDHLTEFVLANADVISFHDYHALHQTIERVGTLKPFGRPILCTEYLARSEGSRFESHLPYFKDNKIAAYNWGFVAGKIQTQYPWSSWQKKFTAEPEVWHHDILRPDGTPHSESEVNFIKAITRAADPKQPRKAP